MSNLGEGSGLLIREAWFESTMGSQTKKGNKMSNTFRTSNDPMKHKTGKPRLGPLNVAQLTKLLETARPRHRAKIQRVLDRRAKTS